MKQTADMRLVPFPGASDPWTPQRLQSAVKAMTTSTRFQNLVIVVIVLNSIVLGIETYPDAIAQHGDALRLIDKGFLLFFVIELALRIYAEPGRFFRDRWNWFDFVIVALSILPFLGNVSALRALRILRALRLLTTIPVLRRVLGGITLAIQNSVPVAVVLAVIMYVYSVMSSKLFGAMDPVHFGDLDAALYTLFQIMTLDDWNAIVRPLVQDHWYAGVFFVSFVFLAVFILLSIVVGIASDAMNRSNHRTSNEDLMDEMRHLHAQIAELNRRLISGTSAPQTPERLHEPPD